jgi:hypothetical protein
MKAISTTTKTPANSSKVFTPESRMKAKRFSRVLDCGWEPLCPKDIPPVDAWEIIDVDEYWELVRKMDLETDLVHLLNERRFWLITFRHMSHGLGKGVFGKAFFLQEAQDARYIAIHGLTQSRRSEVMELVKATRIFYRADRDQMIADFPSFDGEGEFQPTPFLCADDGQDWDAEMIARCFANYILNPPPRPERKGPKTKSKLLKKEHPLRTLALHFNSIAEAEETMERRRVEQVRGSGSKTVGPTIKAKMWRVFCKEVVKEGELPTEASLKGALDLENGSLVDKPYFDRMCNSLGLSWIFPME